ncbi:hypothetical protein [Gemmatimonas phototrophica]|uniref:Uncharacterized protein n=1 Tax=Gemmatimonas phototrophica TaxID=1379270 RepID=A0A143BGN2_9BACT|nr:hypothetical protein [Gemmatimonas phototrophica]AMW03771.1 hypothetical protein GEMMAAP_00765 [Gemmatimonas phototrophica]
MRLRSLLTRPKLAALLLPAAGAAALLFSPAGKLPASARCSLAPGGTMALLKVERDTLLPLTESRQSPVFSSSAPAGGRGEMTDTMIMPAARVRLLNVDDVTRAAFTAAGISDTQPHAYIVAAPYGADCRTIPWSDTVTFAVPGEIGYVRATLAARDRWIGNVPVLVIPDYWNYPYPRRGRPYGVPVNAPLAPAAAMFDAQRLLHRPYYTTRPSPSEIDAAGGERGARAMDWARSNLQHAELEPIRTLVRDAVLETDWRVAQRTPSQLRGTYRVELHADTTTYTWYFRTQPQLAYRWDGERQRTTAELLSSPHIGGYRMVGYAAESLSALTGDPGSGSNRRPLVWLVVNDRPTTPGNEARREFTGVLEFMQSATAEAAWDALAPFTPPLSVADSTMLARMGRPLPRGNRQPRLPITVQLGANESVRADSTWVTAGRRLRVVLTRVDTTTTRRTF